MKISSAVWEKYIENLRKINDAAAAKVSDFYKTRTWTEDNIETLIDYCFAVATKYGEAAAELTAQMYDAVAVTERKVVEAAVPANTATYGEVSKTVRGTLDFSQAPESIGASVARLVKMAGVDTTMQNALRDGAEWAWIPHGYTCAFCIMLASQGWQPASQKAIKGGHAEHIHANCDCTYAIRFNEDSNVAGYDADRYLEMYERADGHTGRQKLNSMRRELYERNKEVINAQKREAYARREDEG